MRRAVRILVRPASKYGTTTIKRKQNAADKTNLISGRVTRRVS